MFPYYGDIISRITDPILWYTANGVPRYDQFHPTKCSCIYINMAALIKISCQSCDAEFLVEEYQEFHAKVTLIEILANRYHFGDPPAHGCVGDTMNCYDLKVMEFWEQEKVFSEWVRNPKYEITLPGGLTQQEVIE